MKQTLLLYATALLLGIQSFAQTGVAINTTGNEPDTSAMLDVSSTTKGMLIPRMTQAQRTEIDNPANGLLVYQTDQPEGFYYFDGSSWSHLASATGTAPGQMQYWNGTAWITVAAGTYGQVLEFRNGAPIWVDKNINTLGIGETYQGGIIAYFLQPTDPGYSATVQHGLIAALADQSSGIEWITGGYTQTTLNNNTSTDLGTGQANTNFMKAQTGYTGGAAKVCDDYTNTETGTGVYSDWYLPSRDELDKLYAMKVLGFGNFGSNIYWSSCEFFAYTAMEQNFDQFGSKSHQNKASTGYVRAVRAF